VVFLRLKRKRLVSGADGSQTTLRPCSHAQKTATFALPLQTALAAATTAAAASSPGGSGDNSALTAEVAQLKSALAAANARVAALEGAEAKLKQVAAIINA
jgi:hypothetical protein